MVELKLSVVDCLALETLLSQLDSNLELGDSFKGLVSRFRSSLHDSGILSVKGDLLPFFINEDS